MKCPVSDDKSLILYCITDYNTASTLVTNSTQKCQQIKCEIKKTYLLKQVFYMSLDSFIVSRFSQDTYPGASQVQCFTGCATKHALSCQKSHTYGVGYVMRMSKLLV